MSDITLNDIIASSTKKTPVKAYIRFERETEVKGVRNFGTRDKLLLGELSDVLSVIDLHKENIIDYEIEFTCKNSAVPLIDLHNINARIEPGAVIREGAVIRDNAIILMGAIINTGADIGENSMIDMNAVVGGGAVVGKNCHIGAGAVLAGMVEPVCDRPVNIGDNVFIGANAVICEGVSVGDNSIVGAGAVVLSDIPANTVAVGIPAKVIKSRDDTTAVIDERLRKL